MKEVLFERSMFDGRARLSVGPFGEEPTASEESFLQSFIPRAVYAAGGWGRGSSHGYRARSGPSRVLASVSCRRSPDGEPDPNVIASTDGLLPSRRIALMALGSEEQFRARFPDIWSVEKPVIVVAPDSEPTSSALLDELLRLQTEASPAVAIVDVCPLVITAWFRRASIDLYAADQDACVPALNEAAAALGLPVREVVEHF